MNRIQDPYWAADRLGGELRVETHYDGRRMRCFSERPRSLSEMFADLARRFPDRPAVVEDRELTYGQLERIADTLAAGLARHGIAAGDRVALLLGNCCEFITTLLACFRLGAIAVPIGTRQRRAELEFLLEDCAAKALVFDAALVDAVPTPASTKRPLLRFATHGEAPGALAFADLLAPALPVAMPTLAEEDTAILLYTSGTTGRPKGARLTHLGIIHSALSFARCLHLTEADRSLVAVPLSHVTGLVGVALSTMIVGGCVVLMRNAYRTAEFLELASRQKTTYSILVPAIYTLCATFPELARYDLSAWRIGCFGGAPVPVATIALLAEKLPHLLLINAYGATETTSPATIMPPGCWRARLDSVGQVVPCGEIEVLDERGDPVPPGESGELWIAGPMVVPGYWERSEANRSEFTDGFWRSGDIGSIDAEGFVRVFDRRKDMINRGGFKIYSAEVENTLSEFGGILECAIVGQPDPVLGERVHAFIVPREGSSLDADAVRAYCAERLADYKVPESITISNDPLPRNANGKIQKAVLRQRLSAG